MERAIKDLCRLPDPKLFEEVSTGIGHVVETVRRLDAAAHQLSAAGHDHAARILGNQTQEEAAKVLVLIDAIRCPRDKANEGARTLGYFYDHVAKGIYGEICRWHPADFAEVMKGVQHLRLEHYLDGPNGVDWIFPNRIKQRREDDLYVGYIRVDSEEADQGDCWWTVPRDDDPLGYNTSTVVNVGTALHAVGATCADGLAVIASLWRPTDVRAEMGSDELESLNWQTLERLERQGLLKPVAADVHTIIRCQWPFPLWSLDLRLIEISKKRLREIRSRWAPEDWP